MSSGFDWLGFHDVLAASHKVTLYFAGAIHSGVFVLRAGQRLAPERAVLCAEEVRSRVSRQGWSGRSPPAPGMSRLVFWSCSGSQVSIGDEDFNLAVVELVNAFVLTQHKHWRGSLFCAVVTEKNKQKQNVVYFLWPGVNFALNLQHKTELRCTSSTGNNHFV